MVHHYSAFNANMIECEYGSRLEHLMMIGGEGIAVRSTCKEEVSSTSCVCFHETWIIWFVD